MVKHRALVDATDEVAPFRPILMAALHRRGISGIISDLAFKLFSYINPFSVESCEPIDVAIVPVGNKRRIIQSPTTSIDHDTPSMPGAWPETVDTSSNWPRSLKTRSLFTNGTPRRTPARKTPLRTPNVYPTFPFPNLKLSNGVIESPEDVEMQDASPLQYFRPGFRFGQPAFRPITKPKFEAAIKSLKKKKKRSAHFAENPIKRYKVIGQFEDGGMDQFNKWRSPITHELDSPYFDSPDYYFGHEQDNSPVPMVPPPTPATPSNRHILSPRSRVLKNGSSIMKNGISIIKNGRSIIKHGTSVGGGGGSKPNVRDSNLTSKGTMAVSIGQFIAPPKPTTTRTDISQIGVGHFTTSIPKATPRIRGGASKNSLGRFITTPKAASTATIKAIAASETLKRNNLPGDSVSGNDEVDELIDLWNNQSERFLGPDISDEAKKRFSDARAARKKQRDALVAEHEAKLQEAIRANEKRIAKEKAALEAECKRRQEEMSRLKQEEERARREEEERIKKEQIRASKAKDETEFWRREPEDEWLDKIREAMATQNPNTVLQKHNNITRYDMGTLLPQPGTRDSPSGWLNDQIVNTTLEFMVGRVLEKMGHTKKSPEPAPYWAFNSGWVKVFQEALGEDGSDKFTRWAKKPGIRLTGQNLLKSKVMLFPICNGNHWTILVLYPERQVIEYFDSMDPHGKNGKKYFGYIRRWLKFELKKEYDEDDWIEMTGRSMLQSNCSDCGVFSIWNGAMCLYGGCQPWQGVGAKIIPSLRLTTAAILLAGGCTGDFEFPIVMNSPEQWVNHKEYYKPAYIGKGWLRDEARITWQ